MKNRSLRSHFLMLYVILAVLSGIVVPVLSVYFSANAFRNFQIQQRQENFENLKESLTNLYEEENGIWKRRRVMDILRPAPQWGGMTISLIDSEGREIFTLKPLQNYRSFNHQIYQNDKTEHMTFNLGREKIIGKLEIERKIPSGRFELSYIKYLMKYNLSGALIMIAIACGFGFFVSGKLSRPVIKAIERTRRISKGDYVINEKFPSVGIIELDALTRGVEELGRSLDGQEKLRKRLMVDVAHELKTPLTVIRTQIEAMADGILEPSEERLNLCLNEIKRLGGLIENVESLTRLEGETLKINTEITDMKEFLNPVIESFRPLYERSEINLSSELSENLKCEIDYDKFRHVIDNLLSNSLRYTDKEGEVKVKLYKSENNILIEVIDNGIGISEKDLPNIFERFYRADESRARVTGGSGVGLAIVKASVEAHGGKIEAESIKGNGSCFRIILPCVIYS